MAERHQQLRTETPWHFKVRRWYRVVCAVIIVTSVFCLLRPVVSAFIDARTVSGALRILDTRRDALAEIATGGTLMVLGIMLIVAEGFAAHWLNPKLSGRCEQCGYSLQNLKSRRCPECGHVQTTAVVHEADDVSDGL